MNKIDWMKSNEKTVNAKMVLQASIDKIFPLLCPVEEYKWFSGWECTMIHSNSGVAEENAVFMTKDADGTDTIWTVITYKPYELIEFLIYKFDGAVERFSISLTKKDNNTTELLWTSRAIAYTEKEISKSLNNSDSAFQLFLDKRKIELEYYLSNGEMISEF